MRQPRPQGSTYLSLKFQDSNHEQDKQNLFRHIITIYTTDGFRWNGKPTNIPQLSQVLRIPQTDIMDLVSQAGTRMGSLASPQNIKSTLETLITLSTSFALQDRGLIMEQLSQLKEAQGDGYRAFVSSEVNKTLKLALDSNKNLLDLYKTFFSTPTSTTNILIQGADQGNEQEYLSPDDALVLIQRKGLPANDNRTIPAIPSPSAASDTAQLADKLHDQYGVGDLEDVRENRSGTEALQAPGQESPPAKRPASLPADKEEDGGFERRGIDIEDVDIIA